MTGQGSEAVGPDITNPTKLVAESVLHFVLDSTVRDADFRTGSRNLESSTDFEESCSHNSEMV